MKINNNNNYWEYGGFLEANKINLQSNFFNKFGNGNWFYLFYSGASFTLLKFAFPLEF